MSVAAAALLTFACSNSAAPSPSTGPPSGPVTIRGTERLTWNQTARDTQELATIGYAVYIDTATRVVLAATCATTADSSGFECRSPIPPLSGGAHTLEIASFYQSDPSQESPRSNQIQVTMTAATGIATDTAAARSESASAPDRARRTLSAAAASADEGATWPAGAMRVAEALDNPSDLAFTPDGRLWIAEGAGRIRVVRDAALVAQPALTLDNGAVLLALTTDPQFARTHFLYALYAGRSRAGAPSFAVARFREAHDTLADPVVLLDNVPASDDPHAALRFGPDGKLYAAFDDGGDERLVDDAASFNGKILRLSPDGTTPDDSPRKSPIYATAGSSPRGLAWDRGSGRLWEADRSRVGTILWTPEPLGIAALEDDLLVASAVGLVRTAVDRQNPRRLAAVTQLLGEVPVRAVAVAPDGRVYFATADAIGVLAR